jgi:hypothetical protein
LKAIFLEDADIALALLARNADTHKSVPILNHLSFDALSLAHIMDLPKVVKAIQELRKTKQPSRLILYATKLLAEARIK